MELALDLHWAWNPGTDELWALLDPDLWAATHNPWVVADDVEGEAGGLPRAAKVPEAGRDAPRSPAPAPGRDSVVPAEPSEAPLTRVAYFSMEFALSEALPIYSGGLGNVAGDQLKPACDPGVPVSASASSSGTDDHGDRHRNDHEMTTTTTGMMADGPLLRV